MLLDSLPLALDFLSMSPPPAPTATPGDWWWPGWSVSPGRAAHDLLVHWLLAVKAAHP